MLLFVIPVRLLYHNLDELWPDIIKEKRTPIRSKLIIYKKGLTNVTVLCYAVTHGGTNT